jgi:hypothetical protein
MVKTSKDLKSTEGSPNLSVYRVRTVPYRTVAYRTVAYRTVPYRTVPYRTVPYRTVPYPTVPYRFPRETVLVDREAYRTFLTVFRDFCLKARTLPRFKFYRSAV